MTDYKQIITRNPNKRFGKPCIRQTRITVYDVLGWLASGEGKQFVARHKGYESQDTGTIRLTHNPT